MPLVIDDSAPSNRLVEYVLRVDIFAFFHQRIIFYFCDTCGKQFSRLFNMQRHVRNVHKQGSYTKPQGSHTKHWLVDQAFTLHMYQQSILARLLTHCLVSQTMATNSFQARSQLNHFEGVGHIFIYSYSAQLFLLKSIALIVCEHKYTPQ